MDLVSNKVLRLSCHIVAVGATFSTSLVAMLVRLGLAATRVRVILDVLSVKSADLLWVTARPVLDPGHHVALNRGHVAGVEVEGVEHRSETGVCCLSRVDVCVVPCFHDKLDRMSHDNLGDVSGDLVEDETKVVLAEHRVRGVACVRVVKDLSRASQ